MKFINIILLVVFFICFRLLFYSAVNISSVLREYHTTKQDYINERIKVLTSGEPINYNGMQSDGEDYIHGPDLEAAYLYREQNLKEKAYIEYLNQNNKRMINDIHLTLERS